MKNDPFRDFLRRTDALAVALGINVQDLPDLVGISRATLFACRHGKRAITRKTWLKLEDAERKAGIINTLGNAMRSEHRTKEGTAMPSEEAAVKELQKSVASQFTPEMRRSYLAFKALMALEAVGISEEELDLPLEQLVKRIESKRRK